MKEDKSGFTRYLKQYLSSAINLFPQFYTRVSQLLRPLVSLIALLNNSVITHTTASAVLLYNRRILIEAVDGKIEQMLFLDLVVYLVWFLTTSKQTLPLTLCDRL